MSVENAKIRALPNDIRQFFFDWAQTPDDFWNGGTFFDWCAQGNSRAAAVPLYQSE